MGGSYSAVNSFLSLILFKFRVSALGIGCCNYMRSFLSLIFLSPKLTENTKLSVLSVFQKKVPTNRSLLENSGEDLLEVFGTHLLYEGYKEGLLCVFVKTSLQRFVFL